MTRGVGTTLLNRTPVFTGQMDLIISATVRCDEKSVVSEAKLPLYTILIAYTVYTCCLSGYENVMLTLNVPSC